MDSDEGVTEDLTWGYKTPQSQLLILGIRQMAQRGCTVRWHQETVHKQRHTAVPMIRPTDPPDLRTLIRTGTYLICWAISKIPRLSHAAPERHSSRYSVHAGTFQSTSGIFCIFSSKHGPVPRTYSSL